MADEDTQGTMADYMAQQAIYGNQEALYTSQRAAYGNMPMYGFQGATTVGAGAYQGMGTMFSDLGGMIRPISYTPPARVNVGYYGQTQQQTGFFRGAAGILGLTEVPRGMNAFEYRQREVGDFAERVAGGLAGAGIMGAGLAAGALLGAGPGMGIAGAAGAALGSPFGPVGSAAGRFAGGMLGGYMVAGAVANQVVDSVAERRELNNFLESSSFRYVGSGSSMADPRTGSGMSSRARSEATSFLREQDFKDPTLDSSDMKNILAESSRLGLMTGAQDIEQFKKKFKNITESVKTITKAFETTIEEGLKIMKDFKNIGIDPSQVRQYAANAQTMGTATGRTSQEIMGLGLQGAELFRGTGVDMSIGYQSNVMNLSAIRASRDANLLSQEAISQAGGEEALAQRMTASGLQFAQSQAGRGYLAAFSNSGAGGLMSAITDPNKSFTDLAVDAMHNLDTPAKLLEYQANQAKKTSELGKAFGGQGLVFAQNNEALRQAQFMATSTGASVDVMLRNIFQNQGMSEPEIETRIATMQNAPDQFKANVAATNVTRAKDMFEQTEQNFFLYRGTDQLKDVVNRGWNAMAEPIDSMIESAKEGTIHTFNEQMYGFVQADVSGVDYGAYSGDRSRRDPSRRAATNLDLGASIFGTSAGESIANAFSEGGLETLGIANTTRRGEAGEGDLTLDKRVMGEDVVMSRADLLDAVEKSRIATVSAADAKKLNDEGKLKEVRDRNGASVTEKSILGLYVEGAISDKSSVKDIAMRVYGKDLQDLSSNEYAALTLGAQGTPELKDKFEKARQAALSLESVNSALAVADNTEDLQTIDKNRQQIQSKAGLSYGLSNKAVEALSRGGDKALNDAVKLQIAENSRLGNKVSTSTLEADLRRIQSGEDFQGSLGAVLNASDNIASTQMTLGMSRYTGNLTREAKLSGLGVTEQFALTKAIDAVKGGSAESVLQISDAQAKLLNKLPTGGALVAERAALMQVDKISKSEEYTRETDEGKKRQIFMSGMKDTLGFSNLKEDQKEALASKFTKTGGAASVQQQMFNQFQAQSAGDVSTAGAVLGGRGMENTSAEQIAQTQIAINQQILTALEAMNSQRMGK